MLAPLGKSRNCVDIERSIYLDFPYRIHKIIQHKNFYPLNVKCYSIYTECERYYISLLRDTKMKQKLEVNGENYLGG